MGDAGAGHREIGHTADWELEVWAPDLAALLVEAARGMYELLGVGIAAAPRVGRRLELDVADREHALVGFLGELLHLAESEGVAFDRFEVVVTGDRLVATVEGAPLASMTKEIKAVTYHRLAVRDTDRGVETRIVFDV